MSKKSVKKLARKQAHKALLDSIDRVKYRHYRIVSDNIPGLPNGFKLNPMLVTMGGFDPEFDVLSSSGGLTVAEVIFKDGTAKFGVAECSPDCNFNKKNGRNKAYFRALSGEKPPKNNSLVATVALPEFVQDILAY